MNKLECFIMPNCFILVLYLMVRLTGWSTLSGPLSRQAPGLSTDKHPSLSRRSLNDEEKLNERPSLSYPSVSVEELKKDMITTNIKCKKQNILNVGENFLMRQNVWKFTTLYFLCNFRICSVSYNVCPWQALPAWCIVTLQLIGLIHKLQRN